MSIFADAARIISNLANFGSQFIGLDANLALPTSDSGGGGEYRAASVTGMTGGLGSSLNSRQVITGIGKWGGSLAEWDRDFITKKGTVDPPNWRMALHSKVVYEPADKARIARYGRQVGGQQIYNSNTGASVNILPWTASVVGYLELLTGFGPPNEGDGLKVGAELWSTFRNELVSAIPDEDWQGEASDAYAGQVAALQDIAQTLADLDGQLAEIVTNQAEWVTHIRLGFGILLNLLTAAIAIEVALRIALATVPGGPAWAMGWAIAASSLAMAATLGMLGALTGLSVENGKKADRVASEIDRLGGAAAQLVNESMARSVGSAASQSRVSDFQTISQGTPATIAAPGGGRSARRKAAQGEAENGQAGTSATPDSQRGQDPRRDDKPNLTMPTLGALMHMSKQAKDNSGPSPRRPGSLNQGAGERQQPDTIETHGAGAGADSVDRAPVEATRQINKTIPHQPAP